MLHCLKAFFCILLLNGAELTKLPCPLVWQTVSSIGAARIPVNVSALSAKNFVGKARVNGIDVTGNIDGELGYALLPNIPNNDVVNEPIFDILTNPNSCTISWEETTSSFAVPVGNGLVGRAVSNHEFFAGHIQGNSIYIASPSGLRETEFDFQYLTSFHSHLWMEQTEVITAQNDYEVTQKVFGIEEIHNPTPALVKQSLEHKTRTYESASITTHSKWHSGSRLRTKFGFDIGEVFKITLELATFHANDGGGSQVKSLFKSVSKEVKIGREITVDPYTSVRACSVSYTVKDFEGSFSSVDKYFAPGLSGDFVYNVLMEEGIQGTIEGNSVLVNNQGNVKADIFLTTKFFVVPIEDETTCNANGATFGSHGKVMIHSVY